MLSVGQKFPHFSLTGVVVERPAARLPAVRPGFTPRQMEGRVLLAEGFHVRVSDGAAFGKLNREFADRDAVLYGVSTDSEFVHLAWRNDKEELRNLPFPMLGHQARADDGVGVLDPEAGVAQRATFIDPQGVIRFVRDRPERRPQPG